MLQTVVHEEIDPSTPNFVFIENIQYKNSNLTYAGFIYVSYVVIKILTSLEMKFKSTLPLTIYKDKMFSTLVHILADCVNDIQVTCGNPKCIPGKNYTIKLYTSVKLHLVLRKKKRN